MRGGKIDGTDKCANTYPFLTTTHATWRRGVMASPYSISDSDIGRFWANVQKSDGCWEWQGYRVAAQNLKGEPGYGTIYTRIALTPRYKKWLAHRFSWVIHFGEITNGLSVCHHCDNRPCVRPDHLFLGTTKDNMADAKAKGRLYVLGPCRARGTRIAQSRLTEDQVRAIRVMVASGQSQKDVARLFGVDPGTIRHAAKRSTWKHVT